MRVNLLDCTLRDGAHVVGNGFPADLTVMMIRGLIDSNIKTIEFGNGYGIGGYEVANKIAPCTDEEYLNLVQPFIDKAEIGMFLNATRYMPKYVDLAAEKGLKFLRVGAEPGKKNISIPVIRDIKNHGMKSRYALMKAYLFSPKQLAEEAKALQDAGLDGVTIMDSAGYMFPEDVKRYVNALVEALDIPVGFHGHNNLGMSVANAVAAYETGASEIDCMLMGMARSAGNLPTENIVLVLKRLGELTDIDEYRLLDFIDQELAPAMKEHDYEAAISPIELILGYAGAHSSFQKSFRKIAEEHNVSTYELIVLTSMLNRRNPSEGQMNAIADYISSRK